MGRRLCCREHGEGIEIPEILAVSHITLSGTEERFCSREDIAPHSGGHATKPNQRAALWHSSQARRSWRALQMTAHFRLKLSVITKA